MTRIACDIVLLPPRAIAEAAVRLNRALRERFAPKIVLNENDCLPHLSLAMGALREERFPAAADLLMEIASHFPPVGLTCTGIEAGPIATGEMISTLKIEQTPALQSLHETLLRRMKPLLTEKAAADDFIGAPQVHQTSVDWVNRYATASSFDRFSPHITVGVGTLEPNTPLPPPGVATRLALCHLGDYCTCRKTLFEIELREDAARPRQE